MTITTFASYKDKINNLRLELPFLKTSIVTVVGLPFSMWTTGTDPGVAPTTAAACTNATAGAMPNFVVTGGEGRVGRVHHSASSVATWMLCDRLSHQGGLSAIVTGAQTTNLPTSALTRYTDGIGVFAALEIYTLIGVTATTVTADYVDTNNVTQTSPTVAIGGTNNREASRLIQLPYVQNGIGVKSVSSVNVAATTGTAGAFGVTLYKPLLTINVEAGQQNMVQDQLLTASGLPRVFDNACLFWVCIPNATVSGQITGAVHIVES